MECEEIHADLNYVDDFGSKITLISHAIGQSFNKLFHDYDLTYPQSRVLTYLMEHQDGCVNQRELERALGLKASSVSSLVTKLTAKGFLVCERTEADARSKHIVLTQRAQDLKFVLDGAVDKIEAALGEGMEPDERQIVDRALEKMVRNILRIT